MSGLQLHGDTFCLLLLSRAAPTQTHLCLLSALHSPDRECSLYIAPETTTSQFCPPENQRGGFNPLNTEPNVLQPLSRPTAVPRYVTVSIMLLLALRPC